MSRLALESSSSFLLNQCQKLQNILTFPLTTLSHVLEHVTLNRNGVLRAATCLQKLTPQQLDLIETSPTTFRHTSYQDLQTSTLQQPDLAATSPMTFRRMSYQDPQSTIQQQPDLIGACLTTFRHKSCQDPQRLLPAKDGLTLSVTRSRSLLSL
jgi:hypothetical protein